jgi:uncharacterized membrane protein
VAWLDAVRGLAVLGMLETHTVNTLLAPAWKENEWFPWLVFLNGLVAPAFLWIAGVAQGLGWQRRVARGDTGWPMRSLRRLAGIWLLGYALHLPWGLTAHAWRAFFATDVLQCLGLSLLMAIALEKACHPRGVWALAAAGLAVLVAGAWPAPPSAGFWPVDAYFDQSGVSLFPLIPWAAFVFLGGAMARWPLHPGWLAAAGVVLSFTPQPDAFSKTHPCFFLERTGWLFLGVSLVIGWGRLGSFPQWLLFAGRHSLVIYVAHLVILFALPFQRWVGPTLAPPAVAAAAAGVTLGSLAAAWLYDRWNRRSPATHVP